MLPINFKMSTQDKCAEAPCRWRDVPLHRRASLQVLLDLGGVFAVETLGLLVELGVPLVDVVDVGVVVVGPASAVLGPLLDPADKAVALGKVVSLADFSKR